jgi:hypothetical protein
MKGEFRRIASRVMRHSRFKATTHGFATSPQSGYGVTACISNCQLTTETTATLYRVRTHRLSYQDCKTDEGISGGGKTLLNRTTRPSVD